MRKDFKDARVENTVRVRDEAAAFRQTCVLRMQIYFSRVMIPRVTHDSPNTIFKLRVLQLERYLRHEVRPSYTHHNDQNRSASATKPKPS